jgi:hypothetical protein
LADNNPFYAISAANIPPQQEGRATNGVDLMGAGTKNAIGDCELFMYVRNGRYFFRMGFVLIFPQEACELFKEIGQARVGDG